MRRKGFTLIELMIVVAIIGILAAIAIPKFADLIRKSREGATKGNLGRLKSAINIYYSDMEGVYPGHPHSLTISGKYLDAFPKAKLPNYHPDSDAVVFGSEGFDLNDAGGWAYGNVGANMGSILLNCQHTDSKGTTWSSH